MIFLCNAHSCKDAETASHFGTVDGTLGGTARGWLVQSLLVREEVRLGNHR
jgi:hypothetical protein